MKRVGAIALGTAGALACVFLTAHKATSSVTAPPIAVVTSTLLSGVGAVVEADVVGATYKYDEHTGPRTEVTLANVVVHHGKLPGNMTSLSQLGGPLPNGDYVGTSELPVLNPGSRYVLFLMAGQWFYSPIWAALAFRVEQVGGRSVITDPSGHLVSHFGPEGVIAGTTLVVDHSAGSDPLLPLAARTVDVSTADVQQALDRNVFLSQVTDAIARVGGLSSDPVVSSPEARPQWGVTSTLPAR